MLFEHTLVNIDSDIKIVGKKFVSRGGEKLDRFISGSNLIIDQKICLDVGASTGGFTDAFLKRGAKKVYCIDISNTNNDINVGYKSLIEYDIRHLLAISDSEDIVLIGRANQLLHWVKSNKFSGYTG